jgi:hypothetical protein
MEYLSISPILLYTVLTLLVPFGKAVSGWCLLWFYIPYRFSIDREFLALVPY